MLNKDLTFHVLNISSTAECEPTDNLYSHPMFIKCSTGLFTKIFQTSQKVAIITILKISSDNPTWVFSLTNINYSTPKITTLELYVFTLHPNDLILDFHLMS